MADTNDLLEVCTDLIRLVEGVGCKDWRDQNGLRFKDTNEWVRAYVAINNARKESRKATPLPADAALADAREQKPVAYMHNKRVDVIHTSVKSLLSDFAVNSGPESMLRPIDKSENYTIPLYAAAPVPAQPVADVTAIAKAVRDIPSRIESLGGQRFAYVKLSEVIDTIYSMAGKHPAAAKGSTHCDECGCDWLDNGLNPVGCPYCKRNDDKFNPCLNSLVRQVALMMDDCEEHADGSITIDCDISQGFLRRIYDLLNALEDCGYDAIEPQPAAVPEAGAKDVSALDAAGQFNRKVAYAWFPLRISRKRQLISDCGITMPQALTESDSQWAMRALLAMLERAECRSAILSAADAEVKNG